MTLLSDIAQIALIALAVMWLITNIRINRTAKNLCRAIIRGDYLTYRKATGTAGAPYEELNIEDDLSKEA